MRLLRFFSSVLTVLLILCASSCLARGEGETRILVVETTDIHGYIMDASGGETDTFQYRMAYIAHLVNEARASGRYDDLILLDGGDLYQGAAISNLTGGATIRAVVDMMGYDAVGLGNHEFDWDVTEYAADSEGTVAPYVLGDYFGDDDAPVLASDLYDAQTGDRVAFTKDYTIVEKAGERVAVIGYIPDYRSDITTSLIAPYLIDGDLENLDALVRSVHEAENPDAIVILAHDDPAPLAEAMDPDLVSLVAGGHTHNISIGTAENGIPYIQGKCQAQGFASAVLVFGADGSVHAEELQYTDIVSDPTLLYDTEENAEHFDPDIMELSRATWEAVSEEMNEVLGYIDTPVVALPDVRTHSGGNWVTSLMLRATQDQGTVAAFYNTGGIRADLEIPDGSLTRAVTVYDVYSLAPFGNSLLVYKISGAELRQQLINGLTNKRYGDQMTGLTFTYTASGDDSMDCAEREYDIVSITLSDGTKIDPEDTQTLYRVCVSNHSATMPGSVFENKTPVVPAADAPVDNEAFIRVLREESAANDGHLFVDDAPRSIELKASDEINEAA